MKSGNPVLNNLGEEIRAKHTLTFDKETSNQITYVYFKIKAESGEELPVYKLQIEKMSSDTSLKEIYVEGVEILPNEEGKYVTDLLDTIENSSVKAVTNNELATVRIALGEEALHEVTNDVTLSNNKQTVIPITVRSQSRNYKNNIFIHK